MSYTDFYLFSSLAYGTTLAATPDIFEKALEEGRNDFDRHCHTFLLPGEYIYYQFPIVFRQYDGNRLRDFLDTGYPPVYLISDRVVSILKENGVSGWDNYCIKLYDKKGNIIDGYSGFSVTGKGGVFSKSWDREYNSKDNESYVKTRGLYDISQWDGSDIFLVGRFPITSYIIITERVMKLLETNKVTAVEYERLSDFVDIIGEPRFSND